MSTAGNRLEFIEIGRGIAMLLAVGDLSGLKAGLKIVWVREGVFFGRASYSIYLIHFAVLSATVRLLLPLGLALWLYRVLLWLTGVVMGPLLHQFAVQPLPARIRSLFAKEAS